MPQYFLGRFFVPDDKDVSDMLRSCGTPQDKMWEFAAGYGILLSGEDRRERYWDYLARLPLSRGKLLKLYELNSSSDRDEKYTNRTVGAKVEIDKISTLVNEVREARRKEGLTEKYEVAKVAPNVVEVKVTYVDHDFSKTQSLQLREKELRIVVEKVDDSLAIRYHSNERGSQIVDGIEGRLAATLGETPIRNTLDFSGIRDVKKRTKFFSRLIRALPKTTLADVPILKVYRLQRRVDDEDDEGEEDAFAGEARRVFLSGANLMVTQEYKELEERGFFIGSVTWVAEWGDGENPRYELTALFNDPDAPTHITYAATGKYERGDNGEYRQHKVKVTPIERDALLKSLEQAAGEIYTDILKEGETLPENGNQNQVAQK